MINLTEEYKNSGTLNLLDYYLVNRGMEVFLADGLKDYTDDRENIISKWYKQGIYTMGNFNPAALIIVPNVNLKADSIHPQTGPGPYFKVYDSTDEELCFWGFSKPPLSFITPAKRDYMDCHIQEGLEKEDSLNMILIGYLLDKKTSLIMDAYKNNSWSIRRNRKKEKTNLKDVLTDLLPGLAPDYNHI